MGDFFKSKFDNLCLVGLITFLVVVLMFFEQKSDDKVVAWFEQTITTVLGAYIGLTQAHRLPWLNGKNGDTNGQTKNVVTTSTTDTSH